MLCEESAISEEVIAERGYRSVTTATELRRLNFTDAQCRTPALLVPVWGVHGEQVGYVVRPDEPRLLHGKLAKYENPKGSVNRLDVPPRCRPTLDDPTIPVFVTEGAKKADALATAGACVVNVGGVWNWIGRNDKGGKVALADWYSLALNGRVVRLVFDSDSAAKWQVAVALDRLKRFLEGRDAVVEIIYLSDLRGEKQGIDDYLARGGTLEALAKLVTTEVRFPERQEEGDLPEIGVNGRHLDEISDDCWKVLVAQNERQPFVFQRSGRLCSPHRDEDGVHLVDWSRDDVVFCLERFARFVSTRVVNDEVVTSPARLPDDIVRDLLAAWKKPVNVIRGVVGTPVFAKDGTLVVDQGYQEATQLFYEPTGDPVPEVPAEPSREDVHRALALLLDEWLIDMPFADEASRAHALAAALTPIVRELIDGPDPLVAIDSPGPGSGKGLLAEGIANIVCGSAPGVMSDGRGEEEQRKRITAVLRDGSPVILLDNVTRRLDSGAFAAMLTTTLWVDRLLGKSETIRLPNRSLWLVTGNNILLNAEIGRRTAWIRLDARVDRAWERTGFKHDPLMVWVREHRHELVWALLVLARNWLARGRPAWAAKPLGSFEEWSRVLGGVLKAAGIAGFLENLQELYKRADSETEEWRSFVAAWWQKHSDAPVKTGDLWPLVDEAGLMPSIFRTAKEDASERSLKTRLGAALAKQRDRRYGDFFVRDLGQDAHGKGAVYRLERIEVATGPAERPREEPEGSAQVPQDDRSTADSKAEPAEPAEPIFKAEGREGPAVHVSEGGDNAPDSPVETATTVPHLPQVPQTDSDSGLDFAEPPERSSAEVPHNCPGCRLPMSVARINDVCGRCQAWGRVSKEVVLNGRRA